MLSYSRARGLFAGVSVSGMTLRVDGDADENLYHEKSSRSRFSRAKASPCQTKLSP